MRKKSTVGYELDPKRPLPLTAAQRADLKALSMMSEEQIDTSDLPVLPDAFWHAAVSNPFYKPVKQQLTVRLDIDVLTWLRSKGRGYQTKLNEILRQAMMREVTQPQSGNRSPPHEEAVGVRVKRLAPDGGTFSAWSSAFSAPFTGESLHDSSRV